MRPINYSRTALKALRAIPVKMAARIIEKVEQYAADPASQSNNLKKLHGRDGYRLRVGNYRVIFDETGSVIEVLDIGIRGNIYE